MGEAIGREKLSMVDLVSCCLAPSLSIILHPPSLAPRSPFGRVFARFLVPQTLFSFSHDQSDHRNIRIRNLGFRLIKHRMNRIRRLKNMVLPAGLVQRRCGFARCERDERSIGSQKELVATPPWLCQSASNGDTHGSW